MKYRIKEFKFEKLIIRQKAMDLGEMVNDMTGNFPQKKLFNFSFLIRRAADSVALNISEGSTGQSNPEFKRFMRMAIRSLAEVVTYLQKAKRRNYISDGKFFHYYGNSFNLMNMMVAFKKIANSKNGIQI